MAPQSASCVQGELQLYSSASWNRLMDHQGPFYPLPQLLSTSFYSEECAEVWLPDQTSMLSLNLETTVR